MCLELVSPGARKLMRPEMTSDAWVICVRAAGSDAVLARYRKELGSAITRELDGDDESRDVAGDRELSRPQGSWRMRCRPIGLACFRACNVTVPLMSWRTLLKR